MNSPRRQPITGHQRPLLTPSGYGLCVSTRPTSLCFSITTRETGPLGTGSRPTRLSHSGNLATHRVAGPPCLVQGENLSRNLPLWDDTLPGRHWITSPNLPTTPQPVAELSVPPHAASRAGSRICEADASPEPASGHAPHPGASSPPRHFLMLATNSCAMTRNAGSPYDLPRTFVFGQCVIERYFFIHKARVLAARPRRPDVLAKLDQFFDGSSGPQPDIRIRPSRTWRLPSIRLTLASPASFRSSRP